MCRSNGPNPSLISVIGCRPAFFNKKIIIKYKRLEKLNNYKNRNIVKQIRLEKQNCFKNTMLCVFHCHKNRIKNIQLI